VTGKWAFSKVQVLGLYTFLAVAVVDSSCLGYKRELESSDNCQPQI